MYLLDTNVVSEMRKAGDGKADRHVVAWLQAADTSRFYISPISLLELEVGVLRLSRRDAVQGARLRRWMDTQLIPQFADRMLQIDAAIALACAKLHVPNPQPDNDALIAATAIVHGMTVVTRNVSDFEPLGVPLLNPWVEQLT